MIVEQWPLRVAAALTTSGSDLAGWGLSRRGSFNP